MEKTIIAILATAVTTAAAFSASADTLMGAEIELNAWSQDASYKGSEAGSEVNWTFEAAFEHPIPLVPNIRYSRSSADGEQLEYSKQDVSLYYEILDNRLISVDVGAGLSKLEDGVLDVMGGLDFEGAFPHAYGAAEVGLPGTAISAFVRGNGIMYNDIEVMDLNVGLKNTLQLGLVDVDLQLGYRIQSFDLEDFNSLPVTLDTEVKGAYVGVNFDF